MNTSFTQQTVVLTGATSGIGEAFAHALAPMCGKLVLIGRKQNELEALANKLNAHFRVFDVTDSEFYQYLKSEKVDVLINNAGISQRGSVVDTTSEVVANLMAVNYQAVVDATKAVLPHMLAQGHGRIITVGSMAGKMGSPLRAGYAASKHAVIGFMDCLRAEVFQAGVRVQVVNPSFVKTNLAQNAFAADGSLYGKTDKEIANGMAPDVFVAKTLKGILSNQEEINVATGKAKLGDLLHRINANWYHKAVRKFYRRHI